MLQHTFCHINGIGSKSEEKLWEHGVHTWDELTPAHYNLLPGQARMEIRNVLKLSREALQANNPTFFASRMKTGESWRLYKEFRSHTAFIDIETEGLSPEARITTIALYDGKRVRTYINGQNLDTFPDDIQNYSILVSYNGKVFDIPRIERHFGQKLPHAQIDLRYILPRLGLSGGLKKCEKMIGLDRKALDTINGLYAVYLWRLYEQTGNEDMLETLLAYNVEDTINLERLLIHAWNRHVEKTPFGELALDVPVPPQQPFQPYRYCLDRIRDILPR